MHEWLFTNALVLASMQLDKNNPVTEAAKNIILPFNIQKGFVIVYMLWYYFTTEKIQFVSLTKKKKGRKGTELINNSAAVSK